MYDYEHRQIGKAVTIVHAVIAVVLAVPAVVITIRFGAIHAMGLWLAAALLVGCLMFLDSLTVRVSRNEIVLSYGVGLFRKSIVSDDVQSATIVHCRAKGGRLKGGGRLYKVGGKDAIEIILKNENRIQIGTDQPEALLAAIKTAAGITD